MLCLIPNEESVVPFEYDKEGSEMCMEPKRLMVFDDAAGMLIAFPGINFMSLSTEPI